MLIPLFDFDFGEIPIYIILAAVGVLVALLVFLKRIKPYRLSVKDEERILFAILFGGLAGLLCANISNWFIYPEIRELSFIERIEHGGLIFYYGMLGFFLSAAVLLKLQKMNVLFWLNEIVAPFILFHAFGRIGCSLAGCCYGAAIDPVLIGGLVIDRFPAREIEALCLFTLFFVFHYKITIHRLPLYMLSYSLIRFFLEFGRGDDRGVLFSQALSPAQVTSICIWIGLIIWFVFFRGNKRVFSKENNSCKNKTY